MEGVIALLPAAAQPVAAMRGAFDRQDEMAVSADGLADLATGRAVTPDDPVRVAPMSKLVVAITVG